MTDLMFSSKKAETLKNTYDGFNVFEQKSRNLKEYL